MPLSKSMNFRVLYGIQGFGVATLLAVLAGPVRAELTPPVVSDAPFVAADPLMVNEPLLVDPAPVEPPDAKPLGRTDAPEDPVAPAEPANPYATIVWDESPDAAHATVPAGAPTQVGEASWYGAYFHGRQTASGEIYDMHASTVAHPTWPLGSVIRIQNLRNGRSTLARVTDRGPFARGRILDCSYAVAEMLGFLRAGSAEVQITLLDGDAAAWKRFANRLAPARAPRMKRFGPPAPVEVAVALTAIEDAAPPVPAIDNGTGASTSSLAARPPVRMASMTPFPAIVHAWQSLSRWFAGTGSTHIERGLQHVGLRQIFAWMAGR